MATLQKPELLAPAGDLECARAAVENGADAVYFGLDAGFNARTRAANISLSSLPELLALLHGREVKAYLTLNTLVFTDELPRFEEVVRQVAAAGVDAVLVQDLGVARLVREICQDLPIHASTQMTMTSAECIEAAEDLGLDRVVVARELSIDEIGAIHNKTDTTLEAFAHGALCVAYSGQCLTSESLGGRSANRGQCAQACRLPYEIICDGQDVDLGNVQYLLSPQDLAAYELIPRLIAAGVASLKIEGRLKTPEYVANVTRQYRRAIDEALQDRVLKLSTSEHEQLELSFSRGFSPGWLGGCDHKMLVPGLSSSNRGVLLGEVTEVRGQRVELQLRTGLAAGDGVVFEGDRAQDAEQGGRVYELFRGGKPIKGRVPDGTVEIAFGRGAIDYEQVYVRQKVWKTDDPRLTRQLRGTFSGIVRRVPICVYVEAIAERPLRLTATTAGGNTCEIVSDELLPVARSQPIAIAQLNKHLNRLGNTHYELQAVTADIQGAPMVPLGLLGRARRKMVAALDAALTTPPPRRVATDSVLPSLRPDMRGSSITGDPQLHVLCRSLSQLETLLGLECRSLLVDFQDIREYSQAVSLAHSAEATVWLATPRIQKPDEAPIFRALAKQGANGFLARNLAGIAFCRASDIPFVTDFSLNVANELTTRYLHEKGARRVTVSYDLNRDQVFDLVSMTPPAWLEFVVHQHMPMFHMEHCVYCAVLSPGTNKTNCGRPCDIHQVKLRDRVGAEHTLMADVGCRNTLFNAVPQSSAEAVPRLLEHGARHFRIEFLPETSDAVVAQTVSLYRQLLLGEKTGREVWSELRAANRVGVTHGTMEERRNPLAIL